MFDRDKGVVWLAGALLLAGACTGGGNPGGASGQPPDDANNGDAGGQVDDDTGDDPNNDQPQEDADTPDAEAPPDFADSCLAPVLGCFQGDTAQILSCTVNLFTNEAGVAYDGQRAAISVVDGQGRYLIDTFAEGNVCYTARGLDPGPDPSRWEFTVPGFEATPFALTLNGDEVTVTCLDGQTDGPYPAAPVLAMLPARLSPDEAPCVALDDAQCSVDVDCLGAEVEQCCLTAGTGRCLEAESCPAIPIGLTGCLKDTMDCFGAGRTALSCEISRSTGEVRVEYSAGRRAVYREDQDRVLTMEASNALGTCFSLRAEGRPPWARADITNANTGEVFPILFQGGRAFVTCDEELTEQHPEDFVLRNIPTLVDPDDNTCTLTQ